MPTDTQHTHDRTLGIVVSEADEAAVNIGEHLLDAAVWSEHDDQETDPAAGGGHYATTDGAVLRWIKPRHLDTVDIAAGFDDVDLIAFVSRHAGDTGPLLTGHFTGNLGPAEHGGRPNELALAAPGAIGPLLSALEEHAPPGYDVSIECTHHGPSQVGVPSLFVELGSGPDEWADTAGAAAVARATLALRGVNPQSDRTVVLVGESHYAPRATRIARETDWDVGHVCAKWGLRAIGDDATRTAVIGQAIDRSNACRVVVDGDWPAVHAAVADRECRIVGESYLHETNGVTVELADRVTETLSSVSGGLRFGAAARSADADTEFVTVDVPAELADVAESVDAAAAVDAVGGVSIAYETEEAGNRLGDRAAISAEAGREALIGALLAVLRPEFEIEREGDIVRLRTERFDPDLAREAGVPEGPAFGRLAKGESVTVDGEMIKPGAVTSERIREFRL